MPLTYQIWTINSGQTLYSMMPSAIAWPIISCPQTMQPCAFHIGDRFAICMIISSMMLSAYLIDIVCITPTGRTEAITIFPNIRNTIACGIDRLFVWPRVRLESISSFTSAANPALCNARRDTIMLLYSAELAARRNMSSDCVDPVFGGKIEHNLQAIG